MRMPPPLAHRSFEGLAIQIIPTDAPWIGNEFALFVRRRRRHEGHRAQRHLLFCLLEQPGSVYSFAHLCRALGLKGSVQRKKLTLGEHARRARLMLAQCRLPLHITLAPGIGYALCRKAQPNSR